MNSTRHQWRSIIVVDIVGHADTTPAACSEDQMVAAIRDFMSNVNPEAGYLD